MGLELKPVLPEVSAPLMQLLLLVPQFAVMPWVQLLLLVLQLALLSCLAENLNAFATCRGWQF